MTAKPHFGLWGAVVSCAFIAVAPAGCDYSGGGGSTGGGGPPPPTATCSGAEIQTGAQFFELALQDNATRCVPVAQRFFANSLAEAKQCAESANQNVTALDPINELCDLALRRLLNGQCLNHFTTLNRNFQDAVTCDRNTLCVNCTHVDMTSQFVISTLPGTCRALEVTTGALTCQ